MDLNQHWQRLLGFLPEGVLITAGVIGIVIIIVTIGVWLWKGRQGANLNGKTFPLWPVIIGGILALPTILVPIVLLIVNVILQLFVLLIEFIAGFF